MYSHRYNEGKRVGFDFLFLKGKGVGFIFLANLKGKLPWKHRKNEIGNIGKMRTRGNNETAIKP